MGQSLVGVVRTAARLFFCPDASRHLLPVTDALAGPPAQTVHNIDRTSPTQQLQRITSLTFRLSRLSCRCRGGVSPRGAPDKLYR